MSFGYQILGFGSGGGGVTVTGGDRTATYGAYTVKVFTSTGSLVLSGELTGVDIAVIAGGGGASQTISGGAGAGGVTQYTNQTLSAGSHTVTVGAGANQANGSNSQFASLTASDGGGRSGMYSGGDGYDGGSGGGGAAGGSPSLGGTATSGQGNDGGDGGDYPGGGGGFGAVGVDAATDSKAGNGGAGGSTLWSMDATNTSALLWAAQVGTNSSNVELNTLGSDPGTSYFAGGGGGAHSVDYGRAGVGGGGRGNLNNVTAAGHGIAETGGGGGGRHTSYARGVGGSGCCIIRYTL
jgi:hypothetical protein